MILITIGLVTVPARMRTMKCHLAVLVNSIVDGSKEEHVIQMSLFVGYTSDESIKQTKIMRLVEESQNCGILDTGCSTTVCGQRWLSDYLNNLCDEELAMVREGNSSATFTFGDGVMHRSIKHVVFPCWIGGVRSELTTDVVV